MLMNQVGRNICHVWQLEISAETHGFTTHENDRSRSITPVIYDALKVVIEQTI